MRGATPRICAERSAILPSICAGLRQNSYACVRQSLTCVRPRDHRQSLRHFAGRRRWLKAPVTTVARSREVVPRAAKAPTGGGSNHEGSRDDDVNCNRGAGWRRRTTRRTGKGLSHLVGLVRRRCSAPPPTCTSGMASARVQVPGVATTRPCAIAPIRFLAARFAIQHT